jgi:hypothetical protein
MGDAAAFQEDVAERQLGPEFKDVGSECFGGTLLERMLLEADSRQNVAHSEAKERSFAALVFTGRTFVA